MQYSFDFSNYQPRKAANQLRFQDVHKDILFTFKHVVELAHRETIDFVSNLPEEERGRSIYANVCNGKVCGKMVIKYPEKCKKGKYGRICYVLDGTISYFKKLNKNLKPSHALSKYSQELLKNIQLNHKSEGAVVWLGYTTTDDWEMLTGIYAVYLEDGHKVWEIDVNEFVNNTTQSDTSITFAPIKPVNPILKTRDQDKAANN